MAVVLLAVGYPVALAVLARLRSVLVLRWARAFLTLEVAMTCIVAGWVLYGRPLAALVNAVALVAFAAAWVITGRRGARPKTGAA